MVQTGKQRPPGVERPVGSSGRKCMEEEKWFRKPDMERKLGAGVRNPWGLSR